MESLSIFRVCLYSQMKARRRLACAMKDHTEMQPKRAAPRTARACSLSVGHAGLHMVGTSAAPNSLQMWRAEVPRSVLAAIPSLAHSENPGCVQSSTPKSDHSRDPLQEVHSRLSTEQPDSHSEQKGCLQICAGTADFRENTRPSCSLSLCPALC